ncbi:MAG: outer membrane lipoprotein carrier protein LolA [Bacteroidota bacterium]|nr:MAG: outer membrane lipoprotein carrier protein LolA [Bacteroidota bacterium]
MKAQITYIIALIVPVLVSGQQDPEAKKILDRVSEKMKTYQTIEADFELVIDNRMDNLHSKTSGSIEIKGEKYILQSMGTSVYFDGKTMWSYMTDINEVTITQPGKGEGDFVDNPALIFSFYDKNFKYQLIGEAKVDNYWAYEIDLYPVDLNQPYSRFKLFIRKDTDAIYMMKAISKDAIDYTIFILNTRYDKPMDDSRFTFKPENYPKIEVVDLRF